MRYLSEQRMLVSTQTTIQDAVAQLRATEVDKHVTFIVDMACQGMSVILEEVQTHLLRALRYDVMRVFLSSPPEL
jgi:hypothetical protein